MQWLNTVTRLAKFTIINKCYLVNNLVLIIIVKLRANSVLIVNENEYENA